MRRYIDADALVEMLNSKAKTDYEMGLYNHGALTQSFIKVVERHPTADVVEVVRCKDCKHWENRYRYCKRIGVDFLGNSRCGENDYCSYGERREKNEG